MVERQPNRRPTPILDDQQAPQEVGKVSLGLPFTTHERAKPPPESAEGNPLISPLEQKEEENATKLSRIPEHIIVFVQHAYASGADESLKERQRIFLAHAITKPDLTFEELAPFMGRKAEAARHLWNTSLIQLWQSSPSELQQKYPLNLLIGRRRKGQPGVPLSPETRRLLSESHKGRPGRPHTAESKAKIGKGRLGKKHTPEIKARLSEAKRKYWERKKQQEADLTQREQE